MTDNLLERLSKHVPRLLRHQIIAKIIEQTFSDGKLHTETLSHIGCSPSIERFYGSILFIDISGFTALSQRLNVESLKTHINGYFKKILDIIENHDGEVIKFAGDALFVVWQINANLNHGMYLYLNGLIDVVNKINFRFHRI